MTWPLLQFVFVSLAVVGLIYMALRYVAPKLRVQGRHLRVLEAASLGPGKSLALVKVGEEVHLFAITAKGIESLGVTGILPDEAHPATPGRHVDFGELLDRALGPSGSAGSLAARIRKLRRSRR